MMVYLVSSEGNNLIVVSADPPVQVAFFAVAESGTRWTFARRNVVIAQWTMGRSLNVIFCFRLAP